MVPSAFLLLPQTPSQPEPNSGWPRSLRELFAVTPCAQHAHFPKPEFLALHVPVWLPLGSPPVSVAEPFVLHYCHQSHCPPLTEWRQSPTAQSSTAPVARHLLMSSMYWKHHVVIFLLGSSQSEGQIPATPPSNRVTSWWRRPLYRSPGATCGKYIGIWVAIKVKSTQLMPIAHVRWCTWSSPTIVWYSYSLWITIQKCVPCLTSIPTGHCSHSGRCSSGRTIWLAPEGQLGHACPNIKSLSLAEHATRYFGWFSLMQVLRGCGHPNRSSPCVLVLTSQQHFDQTSSTCGLVRF